MYARPRSWQPLPTVQNGETMPEIEFLRGFAFTFALAQKALPQLPGSEKLFDWIAELRRQFHFPSLSLQRHHAFSLSLTLSGLALDTKFS